MLNEFVTSNSLELITRCRARATKRFAPNKVPAAIDHGVPQFLHQLAETLAAGATGTLLSSALEELHSPAERSLPEIRHAMARPAMISP